MTVCGSVRHIIGAIYVNLFETTCSMPVDQHVDSTIQIYVVIYGMHVFRQAGSQFSS